jgi:hypothetical protein
MYLAESRLGRHSRKMPTSDWESVRQLRGDALWKDADQVLLTRAMLRCGLAAGWVTLAALTISGGAWIGGLPMLLASSLSLLHASHTVVLRLEGRLPRPLRRLFERLFVYPDQPHVNWIGIAELLGLVSLGIATGWPLRLLADDPATAAVGSVITVGILGSVVANTAGHLVWEVDQDDTAPKWMRSVRMFIGPFGAAVGLALLWWASPATPARFVAVAGPLLVMVGSWRLIAQVKAQVKDMDDMREQTIDLTRRQDSDLVHSALKNQARAIMDDLVLIPDASLRDGVKRLCYNIDAFRGSLLAGGPSNISNADQVLQALLHFNTEWAARYGASVTHDLEAADLSHRDAGIIFMAVSDLVTNAAQRSAEHLEVALTSTPADYGSILNLTVLCRCGGRVEPGNIPADSSLMELTRLVYGERGTLKVHDAGDGSHVFDLTWPSTRRPRARVIAATEPLETAHV